MSPEARKAIEAQRAADEHRATVRREAELAAARLNQLQQSECFPIVEEVRRFYFWAMKNRVQAPGVYRLREWHLKRLGDVRFKWLRGDPKGWTLLAHVKSWTEKHMEPPYNPYCHDGTGPLEEVTVHLQKRTDLVLLSDGSLVGVDDTAVLRFGSLDVWNSFSEVPIEVYSTYGLGATQYLPGIEHLQTVRTRIARIVAASPHDWI
jgi:hypothetical protein